MASNAPSPDQVPRATARVAHQVVAGEAVLVHLPRFHAAGLNDTGAFVWRHVDGRRSVRDIARLLAAEYGIQESAALEDVGRLLGKLHERDLVEWVTA